MLQRLLYEIQAGGTLEPGILASRLGTTPQMVTVMLEHLARQGLLKAVPACNSQGCDGCGGPGACSSERSRGRVWKLKSSN